MQNNNKTPVNDLHLVIVGHVDHGKSTVIGRLLADTGSLPEGKLEQIQEMCRRNSKPFEYAFLLDALKDERSQGITIDTARSFFETEFRKYIIIDAPGHIEFLKNMITGASRAEAALLVIDAKEGIKENSRRHGYMLSMIGIKQTAVLVNKMDLVDYDENVFNSIVNEYSLFLDKINVKPKTFIPVSAMQGDNIAAKSKKMPWYSGQNVLELLDEFESASEPDDADFRMYVQDIYKFTSSGDDRRIVAGTVESGKLCVGDEVIFYPSAKKSTVKSIEAFNEDKKNGISAGYAAGFTLTDQIYIRRGELCVKLNGEKPLVSAKFKTSLFWLGKEPLKKNKTYFLKIGAAKISVKLMEIVRIINASTLEESEGAGNAVNRHEVAECIFAADKPAAFDRADFMSATSRFVIVDNYEISGGGIITENVEDDLSSIREKVLIRNFKWEQGRVTGLMRAERLGQKASLIIITGERATNKKEIAKTLELNLFTSGRLVYYLGIGNLLYGVDADIKTAESSDRLAERAEHMRRLAETSNILLETGAILIVTASLLNRGDIDVMSAILDPELISVYWVGDTADTDIREYTFISEFDDAEKSALVIKNELQEKGIIYKAW